MAKTRKEISRQYQLTHKKQLANYEKQRRIDYPEYAREYYITHIEHIKEYRIKNKNRISQYGKVYRARTKDRIREHNLCKYGITSEGYNKLFELQEGRCLICKKHQSELTKILYVDHDHTTNKIRGLLCIKCNSVIGLANDDTKILENAISYLNNYKNEIL